MLLQQLMLAAVVFLGFRLMCSPQEPPPEKRTSAEMLGSVQNVANQGPDVRQYMDQKQLAAYDRMLKVDPEGAKQLGSVIESLPTYDSKKGTLYWQNARLNWSTAGELNGSFQKRLDEETSKKKETLKDPNALKQLDDEVKLKKLEGDLLVADAQYKFALRNNNDYNQMRLVFGNLQGITRRNLGTDLVQREFQMPATLNPGDLSWWRQPHTWSVKSMTDRLAHEIETHNKAELTYGVFPGYKIIDSLVSLTGSKPGFSYAFAAFLLALIVRAVIFPLAQKQLMWGRKMQQLAPLLKEIREQYTDKKTKQVTNQQELQQRTMALYSEYGMNPLAGCLPAFVQLPLFLTVYQFMLHYQIAFRSGTFLWINPAASASTNGFIAPNLGERDYILIIIYGVTMIVSTLLMPVTDPTQIKQQRMMGVGMGMLFTFMMFTGAFPTPAAFVLYWVFTNLLATAQSLRAYRLPLAPLEKVNTKTGGVFPMSPFPDPKPNGKTNGTITMPGSTGTPAKHKPKKRK
jgi:YidC/Oxa1 family membrane protein insertase